MNVVCLMGNVGKDAELKTFDSGFVVAEFSLATSRKVKGEDRTEWHRVKLLGKMAEALAQYITKGSRVAISGRIEYRKANDGRVFTDIVANEFSFAGGGKGGGGGGGRPSDVDSDPDFTPPF